MALYDPSPKPHRVRVHHGVFAGGGFESASRDIPADLTSYVLEIQGYVERTQGPLERWELPAPQVVLILEFGPPISLLEGGEGRRFRRGFAAGVDDGPSLTRHEGHQAGVQINLTPLGARRFFDRPMVELAGEVVDLGDVLGGDDGEIAHRVGALPTWDARLDAVEALLRRRILGTAVDLGVMPWAVERVMATGGRLDIGVLSDALGYSHKHVIHLFRQHVGVTPRAFARLVRFDGVVARVKSGWAGSWAELALEQGYCDQAHLIREVRAFAGHTPGALPGLLAGFSDASGG